MAITHAILKVARGCNMACRYCYVDHYGFGAKNVELMDENVLELLFQRAAEHVAVNKLTEFTFYWHGGEPLLQPMSFYERAGELSSRYLPDVKVKNLLQTNATLVTPEYARLLKKLGITVSVSIDGPEYINDAYRVDRAGGPTAGRVLEGIENLRSAGYPLQILCVITPASIGHGAEIYRYFRSLGAVWMDFLLPHANRRHTTIIPADMPTQRQLAEFYIDVYNAWMDEGNPEVCVRRLRDYTLLLMGGAPDSCLFGDDCTHIITIQPDGKVHTCDDLLSTFPEALGDIRHNSFDQIEAQPLMARICPRSSTMYGSQCLECEYFDICKAGCTNFRANENGEFIDTYYYCEKTKLVVDYIRNDILKRLSQSGLESKLSNRPICTEIVKQAANS